MVVSDGAAFGNPIGPPLSENEDEDEDDVENPFGMASTTCTMAYLYLNVLLIDCCGRLGRHATLH